MSADPIKPDCNSVHTDQQKGFQFGSYIKAVYGRMWKKVSSFVSSENIQNTFFLNGIKKVSSLFQKNIRNKDSSDKPSKNFDVKSLSITFLTKISRSLGSLKRQASTSFFKVIDVVGNFFKNIFGVDNASLKEKASFDQLEKWRKEFEQLLHTENPTTPFSEEDIDGLKKCLDKIKNNLETLSSAFIASAGDSEKRKSLVTLAEYVVGAREIIGPYNKKENTWEIIKGSGSIGAAIKTTPLMLAANQKIEGKGLTANIVINRIFGDIADPQLELQGSSIEVDMPFSEVYKEVKGNTFVNADGTINRKELQKQVVADLGREISSTPCFINSNMQLKDKAELYDKERNIQITLENVGKALNIDSQNLLDKTMLFFQQGAFSDSKKLADGLTTNQILGNLDSIILAESMTNFGSIQNKWIDISEDKLSLELTTTRFFYVKDREENMFDLVIPVSYHATLHDEQKLKDNPKLKDDFSISVEFLDRKFFDDDPKISFNNMLEAVATIKNTKDISQKKEVSHNLKILGQMLLSPYGENFKKKFVHSAFTEFDKVAEAVRAKLDKVPQGALLHGDFSISVDVLYERYLDANPLEFFNKVNNKITEIEKATDISQDQKALMDLKILGKMLLDPHRESVKNKLKETAFEKCDEIREFIGNKLQEVYKNPFVQDESGCFTSFIS